MAFHQPTRQSLHRAVRLPTEERESPGARSQARPQDNEQLDQSQTSWVLFSPVTDSASASEFSEPTLSLQTPGRSRLSDVGSHHTETRPHQHGEDSVSTAASVAEDHLGEDDGELDSLDSHLPSFRSLPVRATNSQHEQQHAAPVFPSHDGLGSFHLNNPMSGMDAQDQIYQFERFNPRRVRRRRESIERLQAEWDNEHARETEKRQRIEAWRLEHSRVLLDEIQRETRRRRRSQASLRHVQTMSAASVGNQQSGDTGSSDNMTWHDEEAGVSMDEPEGMLSRFTQRVIKDLLGIDDRLLSFLLGETVLEDDEVSSTPRASQINGQAGQPAVEDSPWQVQILERISRELGLLVNQISQHPGAFSTYAKVQHLPLPYAGLPVIPESSAPPAIGEAVTSTHSGQPPTMDFRPTISKPTPAIHIPGRPSDSSTLGEDVNMSNAFTKDEWERDLDIKLVFRYIRSRFTSRASSSPQASGSHLATSSTQDTAAKAARVRQHHPLISRPRATERRSFKVTAPSSPVGMRHHSSCASQSTRRSARRSSCSSRHYWDIGGSLGTGSLIASNGPMGSWGEV